MEKFIEELGAGDIFEVENQRFVITSDFKKNGDRLCINLNTGNVRWFKSDSHVIHISLYAMDNNNNFHPIKEIKSDVSTKIQSIF
jgi:hypothetical protein